MSYTSLVALWLADVFVSARAAGPNLLAGDATECPLRCIYPLQTLNVLVNVLKAVGVPEARRTRINTACLEPTTVERNAPPRSNWMDTYIIFVWAISGFGSAAGSCSTSHGYA